MCMGCTLSHNDPYSGKLRVDGHESDRRHEESKQALLDGDEEFFNLRGLQFLQRFGFDLADTLAGHGQTLTNLLQGAGFIVADPKPESDDGLLARRQGIENSGQLIGQLAPVDMRIGWNGLLIWNHVAKLCLSVTNWRF